MADEKTTPEKQEPTAGEPEKTFTQAELDAIVAKRLARATKGMPDEAELAAYRTWKDSQKTEAQKLADLTKERDEAMKKIEQFEREKVVLAKGVSAEDVDFYIFKAAQLVSDKKTFEQAVDEVIKARPPQSKVVVSLGGSLEKIGGNKNDTNSAMNALIRGARM